jgi:hypothetical protein
MLVFYTLSIGRALTRELRPLDYRLTEALILRMVLVIHLLFHILREYEVIDPRNSQRIGN